MTASQTFSHTRVEEVGEATRPLAKEVTIVLPAFNESGHVGEQVGAVQDVLRASGWIHEVIVVDDGSTDDTAEEAAEAGARVLRHRRNRGYGAALKTGVAAAKYDWILIIDADGTYPTSSIPSLFEASIDADMVVGARTGNSVHIPLIRRPAKCFLGWLAARIAGQAIPDLNSAGQAEYRAFQLQ